MKNFLTKFVTRYGHHLAAICIMATVVVAQRTCYAYLGQPDMPESADKYRIK